MTTNTYLKNIIIGLLFLVLIVPLIVINGLYFPYITGKAFVFRAIIEVAFILYAFLVLQDRSFLPKRSVVWASVAAFLVITGIATIFSENPTRSMWSNFERMEGYVTMIHLVAYVLMLSTVFSRKIWSYFFQTSLVVSLVVGIVALKDLFNGIERISGTLGNSTYLGVYALFHIFLALFLALRLVDARSKLAAEEGNESLNKAELEVTQLSGIPSIVSYIFYGLFFVFNLYIMYQTGTRGSVVGFAIGILVTAVLIAFFERKNRVFRWLSIGMLVFFVGSLAVLGLVRGSTFAKSHPLIDRYSSLVTWDVRSVVQTQGYARGLLWGLGAEGFKERPVFGWGQDNFNYVFAKYFDPRMWGQETWFDRSHNVFFDWLIAAGILGLLAYLSLFATTLYTVWKRAPWSRTGKATLTGLLVAYFIHNLWVFDNLVSYILFFAIIGYIVKEADGDVAEKATYHVPLVSDSSTRLVVGALIACGIVFFSNMAVIAPYKTSGTLISALRDIQAMRAYTKQGQAATETINKYAASSYANFVKALSYNTSGSAEVREQLTESALATLTNPFVDRALALKFNTLVVSEYTKQFTLAPKDPRYYMFYGVYLNQLGLVDQSIVAFQKSLDLSPKKQQFLFNLGNAYVQKAEYTKALPFFKLAYEEDATYSEAVTLYATALAYTGDIKTVGTLLVNKPKILDDQRVMRAYIIGGHSFELIQSLKLKVAAEPLNPEPQLTLASVYAATGDRFSAIATIRAVIASSPQFKDEGEAFIKNIQDGKVPVIK